MNLPSRTTYVVSLIAAVDISNTDLESQIRDWLSNRCQETGHPRSRVGRDLIFRNGYTGISHLASALEQAISGDSTAMLDHTRQQDREIVAAEIQTHLRITPTTAEWCAPRLNQIIRHVVGQYCRQSTRIDYDETLGQAGEWITIQMREGAFDARLRTHGKISNTLLTRSAFQFFRRSAYKSAQCPVARQHGALTQQECENVRDGLPQWVEGAGKCGVGYRQVQALSDEGEVIGVDFVADGGATPESGIAVEWLRREYAQQIKAKHRGNPERYLEVLGMLCDGYDRHEIRENLDGGTASYRTADRLAGTVRGSLRRRDVTREQAEKLIKIAASGVTDMKKQQREMRVDLRTLRKILSYIQNHPTLEMPKPTQKEQDESPQASAEQ